VRASSAVDVCSFYGGYDVSNGVSSACIPSGPNCTDCRRGKTARCVDAARRCRALRWTHGVNRWRALTELWWMQLSRAVRARRAAPRSHRCRASLWHATFVLPGVPRVSALRRAGGPAFADHGRACPRGSVDIPGTYRCIARSHAERRRRDHRSGLPCQSAHGRTHAGRCAYRDGAPLGRRCAGGGRRTPRAHAPPHLARARWCLLHARRLRAVRALECVACALSPAPPLCGRCPRHVVVWPPRAWHGAQRAHGRVTRGRRALAE